MQSKAIDINIVDYSHANNTHFNMNSFALSLVLIVEFFELRHSTQNCTFYENLAHNIFSFVCNVICSVKQTLFQIHHIVFGFCFLLCS